MQPTLERVLVTGLSLLGRRGGVLPASYAEGAEAPSRLPVSEIPAPPAPKAIAAVLEVDEVAAPAPGGMWGLDELGGLALTKDNVEQVLDEMVRPALNADGGDITLHDIDAEGNIYVKLVGSCSTCPSSIMTMKMGVERLLQEEFPSMGELIQVGM